MKYVNKTKDDVLTLSIRLGRLVLDWYVDGQDTIIYTKQDSIKDAHERRIFVDSIYYSDENL